MASPRLRPHLRHVVEVGREGDCCSPWHKSRSSMPAEVRANWGVRRASFQWSKRVPLRRLGKLSRRDLPSDSASVPRTRRSGRSSIVSEPSSFLHTPPKQTSGSVASRNQVIAERVIQFVALQNASTPTLAWKLFQGQ